MIHPVCSQPSHCKRAYIVRIAVQSWHHNFRLLKMRTHPATKLYGKAKGRQRACHGVNCSTVLGSSFDIIDSASAARPSEVGVLEYSIRTPIGTSHARTQSRCPH